MSHASIKRCRLAVRCRQSNRDIHNSLGEDICWLVTTMGVTIRACGWTIEWSRVLLRFSRKRKGGGKKRERRLVAISNALFRKSQHRKIRSLLIESQLKEHQADL